MSARHVVVCIAHGSSGSEPDMGIEGLRAAVGLLRATEQHEVDVLLQGGGAQWIFEVANQEARAMLAQLRASDVRWYVAQAALDSREAPAGVEAVDDEALRHLLESAEVVLRY